MNLTANEKPGNVGIKTAKGESRVWLTAMGLGIGVIMILGLLLLVFAKGLTVHWPSRITECQLKDGAETPLGPKKLLAGEVIMRRPKSDGSGEEVQLHVGNKDAYGQNYVWLPVSSIAKESEPKELLLLERLEYGDAMVRPVSLQADGKSISPDNPEFLSLLHKKLEEGEKRRATIKGIEKGEIGAINKKMKALEIEQKKDTQADFEARKAAYQQEYDTLAARAKTLRDEDAGDKLLATLPDGESKEYAISGLLNAYFPNQLGTWQRVGVWRRHFWEFVSEDPREANTEGGIWPCIFGTFVMTMLMALLVTPLGVIAAIYLREYAYQGFWVRMVRICVNNLAGVPSIVFGVFGMGFFIYTVGHKIDSVFYPRSVYSDPVFGTGGILWASLTLALLTLPVVIVATEEALAAVPRGVREAALACGASKWQMIQRIVLPGAAPGVLTGVILAMARGAGEVAPLMVTGVTKLASELPLDFTAPFIHADRKFMHLGFHIYDVGFQSPDSDAAKPMVFATTLLLIGLVVLMNFAAILLRNHLRKKYAASSF